MENGKKAVVLLAPGFEEIEAISIIDVLRRAGVRTSTAGISGVRRVVGSHDIPVEADVLLEDIEVPGVPGGSGAVPVPDAVILPGGMPGSKNLAEAPGVLALLRSMAAAGNLVAAMCAAPIALHAAGLLDGRRVTAYPSVRDALGGAIYTGRRVEMDGNLITGIGPGAAIEFALKIVAALGFPETAEELAKRMVLRGHAAA